MTANMIRVKRSLFHKGLPYFRYSEKKMDQICMGVDEITHKSFGWALELSQRYNLQDLDIVGRIDEICNGFNIDMQALNEQEPTVALVGKTKAGKSTLLSLLCGMGNEFIGKGDQRTTKFITATHYHGIRIIDTPGLDAASEDGRKDETKTMHACRMADDILFVMSNDTYNNELNFFKQFVAANKPITVLINHKDADIFEYRWKEYRKKPDLWKEHEGEDRMEGWENRIKQHAKENGYEHILLDRIYHTFLLAAKYAMKKGKTLPERWKDRKASRKEWKNICQESDYKQTLEPFLLEFFQNFYMYRLAQHMHISEKVLDDLESYSHILNDQASEWQAEYSNKFQNLMDAKDVFINNCKTIFQDKWQELYIKEIQSSDEFDTNNYKFRNKKFEQYVVSIYNRFSTEVYDMVEKTVVDEYQKLHVKLGQYTIKTILPELMEYGIADQIGSFKTQGSRNVFRLKELYKIISPVLNHFLPIPVGYEISNAVGSIANKKIVSWTELTRERDSIRNGEVKNLFDTMYDFYYGKLEQIIQRITGEIEADTVTVGLRKNIDDSCRLKQFADQLGGITEKARDALYSEYASKLLQLRQKNAQFIDKKIDCDGNGSLKINVYAQQCKEEVITNLKHKVVIKER